MSDSNILTVVSKTREQAHSSLALVPNTKSLVKDLGDKLTIKNCVTSLSRNSRYVNTLSSVVFLADKKYPELINNTINDLLHKLFTLLLEENVFSQSECLRLVSLHNNEISKEELDDNDNLVSKAGSFKNHTVILSELKESNKKNMVIISKIPGKIDKIENEGYCSNQLSLDQFDDNVGDLKNRLACDKRDLEGNFISKNKRLLDFGKIPSPNDKRSYEQSKTDLINKCGTDIKKLEMKLSIEIKRAKRLENAKIGAARKIEDTMKHK